MNKEAASVQASRVAIIGCGHVGTTAAYALLQSELVREIVLLDAEPDRAEGEAMDLQHAVPLGPPVQVWAGDYGEAARSDIVVMAAGASGKPGESRLDMLDRNVGIVRDCLEQLLREGFEGILLMTTNPVDVLAQIAQRESGLPVQRVLGTGTVIDTARLRELLGEELGVEARSVHAFILGEHGDSEMAAWSCAHIAGVPLADFAPADRQPDYNQLLQRVRRAGPEVAARKGSTSFAIASCVRRICEAILRDEHTVLPVSTRMQGQYGIDGVYLSTPCVVGARGVERVIELPLSEAEQGDLRASADVLRRALEGLAAKEGTA